MKKKKFPKTMNEPENIVEQSNINLIKLNLKQRNAPVELESINQILETQNIFLSAIINSSGDIIIFSLDRNYCYTAFNEKHRKEMKQIWNADIKIGMNLLDCMNINELRMLAKQSIDLALNGQSFSEIQHQPDKNIYYEFFWNPVYQKNEVVGITAFIQDITERKLVEQERQANLRFFESLDKINQTILRTNSLQQMMNDVLTTVLKIFDCDRTWLFYPCDPKASLFRVPMEITKPEYPGAGILNVDLPMPSDMAQNLKEVLDSPNPIIYISGTEKPINKVSAEQFKVKSMMMVALYPKTGKPWAFGIHQCSYPRIWTNNEIKLFKEISRRISDALTSFLAYINLQESETKYRRIVDTANEGIWMLNPDDITITINNRMAEMLGYSETEMIGRSYTDYIFSEDIPDHLTKMENRRKGLSENYERRFKRRDGATLWTHVSATPIINDERRYIGSFAMFTDITEHKQAEEALKKRKEELERFERLTIGREIKMIELKKRITELETKPFRKE